MSILSGTIETAPVQVPTALIVKDCDAAAVPAAALKVSLETEGACNVQAGCIFNVTVTAGNVAIVLCVTLS